MEELSHYGCLESFELAIVTHTVRYGAKIHVTLQMSPVRQTRRHRHVPVGFFGELVSDWGPISVCAPSWN